MARLLMQALDRAGYPVFLASDWRTYDRIGNPSDQQHILNKATWEVDRIVKLFANSPPALWFTYHCYYKAPDLIGPKLAQHFQIPYVIAEASRAKKRLIGPWRDFAQAAESAIDAASILFAMTAHDRFALDRDKVGGQKIVDLPPFLDLADFPTPAAKTPGSSLKLLAVAMMRPGVKVESYRRLAAALPHLTRPYELCIVGDGEARAEVEALFPNAFFKGALDGNALRDEYASADVFVWPGVEEAYGMVYLESQASGLPVVAEDHPGPRAVVASRLVPTNDPAEFAAAIEGKHSDPRRFIEDFHSIDRAASILRDTLGPLSCA